MLRALVVLLLAVNGLYFAWTHGYLSFVGGPGGSASVAVGEEAARHRPIDASAVELVDRPESAGPAGADLAESPDGVAAGGPLAALPVDDAGPDAPAEAAVAEPVAAVEPERPPAPRQCMAVTGLSDEQMGPIRTVLQGWPQSQWRVASQTLNGRWMVFWGGVGDELVISARLGELQAKKIAHERLRNHPAGPGFSLGRFSTEAAAMQQKRNMEQQGIHGAEVVLERAAATLYSIEFPDYAAVRESVRRDLSRHFGGKAPQPCAG